MTDPTTLDPPRWRIEIPQGNDDAPSAFPMVEPNETCSGGHDGEYIEYEGFQLDGFAGVHLPPEDDHLAELADIDPVETEAILADDETMAALDEAQGDVEAGRVTEADTGDVPIVECERPAHADGHHGPECHDLAAEDAAYGDGTGEPLPEFDADQERTDG